MIRSLINYCNGIFLVKRITSSYKKTADYALSPSSYLIKRLEKRSKVDIKKQDSINQESPIIKNQIKGTEDEHSDRPDHPMVDNNATLDELKRLNEILPTYQNSHR